MKTSVIFYSKSSPSDQPGFLKVVPFVVLITLLLLVIACARFSLPIPDASTPAPNGGAAAIVFASNRDGNFNLYSMSVNGSKQTQLTTLPKDGLGGDFSPNGQYFAFLTVEPATGSGEVWLMKRNGSEPESFLSPGGSKVSWSPDGRQWVLDSSYRDDAGNDIFVVNLDRSGEKKLTKNDADDTMASWSPNGNHIAFISLRDEVAHIYLMYADGSNQHRLTKGDMAEYGPEWSPDGKMIAFWSGDPDGTTQIYVVSFDGTGLRQLTDSPGINDGVVWSPNGTMLAFSSSRTGSREIYVMNADGSGVVQLTDNLADDMNPAWQLPRHIIIGSRNTPPKLLDQEWVYRFPSDPITVKAPNECVVDMNVEEGPNAVDFITENSLEMCGQFYVLVIDAPTNINSQQMFVTAMRSWFSKVFQPDESKLFNLNLTQTDEREMEIHGDPAYCVQFEDPSKAVVVATARLHRTRITIAAMLYPLEQGYLWIPWGCYEDFVNSVTETAGNQ